LLCLLVLAAAASGEEPKGFLDSPWGTSQETMAKRLPTTVQCQRHTDKSMGCKNYYVGDISITDLVLSFAPSGALSGYTMILPHDSYQKIRATIIEKLGQPTHSTPGLGETVAWEWPSGTTAGLQERCNSFSVSCFGVWTRALMDWNSKDEAIRKEQRKKGF
jgi:hypothetical protein